MTLRQWPIKFTKEQVMKGVPSFKVTESKIPKKYKEFIIAIVSVQPLQMEPLTSKMKYSGKYSIPKYEAYYEYGLWVPADGMETVAKLIEAIEGRSFSTNCFLLPGTGDITTLVILN